jgi:hypothetical protein
MTQKYGQGIKLDILLIIQKVLIIQLPIRLIIGIYFNHYKKRFS